MNTHRLSWISLITLQLGLCTCSVAAQNVAPGINDRYKTDEGRRTAEQIFEDPNRDNYQRTADVIHHMRIEAGDVVCEIGAGTGYFTPYLSQAVGKSGKVYAEEPQPEFVAAIRQKIESKRLRNVIAVQGSYIDTHIEDGLCDIALVLDAYHHFEWPQLMLDSIKQDLAPKGRLVIIDWYRRANPVFDRWGVDAALHVRLDRDEVIREIEGFGWHHLETRDFLEHQYFIVLEPAAKTE